MKKNFVWGIFFAIGIIVFLVMKMSETSSVGEVSQENDRTTKITRVRGKSRSAAFQSELGRIVSVSLENKRAVYKKFFEREMSLNPDLVAFELMDNDYLWHSDKIEIASALVHIWPDIDRLLKWVETDIAGKHKLELLGTVLKRQVIENPSAAIGYLDTLPEGSNDKLELSRMVLATWAIADYQSVLEYVKTLQDSEVSKWGRERAFESLVNNDKTKALELVAKSTDGDGLGYLVSYLGVSRMDSEEPKTVMDWGFSLSGKTGQQARENMLLKWTRLGGAAVAADYLNRQNHSSDTIALAARLAGAWSVSDPVGAADWAQKYADRNSCSEVIGNVIRGWASVDPLEAYTWLGGLPAGAHKDEGIKILVQNEVRADPETVFLWVDSISDPVLRENVYERVKRALVVKEFKE